MVLEKNNSIKRYNTPSFRALDIKELKHKFEEERDLNGISIINSSEDRFQTFMYIKNDGTPSLT